MTTIEELYLRIEALERENTALKGEKAKNKRKLRPRQPEDWYVTYKKLSRKIDSNHIEALSNIIRTACFPKSLHYTAPAGCKGKFRQPSSLRIYEMTDGQYDEYLLVLRSIAGILEEHAYEGGTE